MTQKVDRRTLLAAMSLCLAAPARAQPVIPPTRMAIFDAPPFTHRLDRFHIIGNGGRHYQIFTAMPAGNAPPHGFPVLYLLDGNAAFDMLTAQLLEAVPGLAMIGVGYDIPLRFAVEERSLDYTPPGEGGEPMADPQRPRRMIGGAPEFLAFLVGALRARAEQGVNVDPARRFIFGHSYGGLFALYALAAHSDAFYGYAAVSPSVWRREFDLRRHLANIDWPPETRRTAFIALGDRERRSEKGAERLVGPAPETMEIIDILQATPSLSVRVHVLEGLGHGETLAASLPLVLPWAATLS